MSESMGISSFEKAAKNSTYFYVAIFNSGQCEVGSQFPVPSSLFKRRNIIAAELR